MEEICPDNLYFNFAREMHPYACEIYSAKRVALFMYLVEQAQIDPHEAVDMFYTFFPMTQEEMEIEEKRIMQNALTYRLLFPEQAKEDDELFEKTMQKLKDQGIL
jgi:hypothetical protein